MVARRALIAVELQRAAPCLRRAATRRWSAIGSFPAFVEMRDGSFKSAQDGTLHAQPKGVVLELDGRGYRIPFKTKYIYGSGENATAKPCKLQAWVPTRKPK